MLQIYPPKILFFPENRPNYINVFLELPVPSKEWSDDTDEQDNIDLHHEQEVKQPKSKKHVDREVYRQNCLIANLVEPNCERMKHSVSSALKRGAKDTTTPRSKSSDDTGYNKTFYGPEVAELLFDMRDSMKALQNFMKVLFLHKSLI